MFKDLQTQPIDLSGQTVPTGVATCDSPGCNRETAIEISAHVNGQQVSGRFCQECTHVNAQQLLSDNGLFHTLMRAVEYQRQIDTEHKEKENLRQAEQNRIERKKQAEAEAARKEAEAQKARDRQAESLKLERVPFGNQTCGFDGCGNPRAYLASVEWDDKTIKAPVCQECQVKRDRLSISEMTKNLHREKAAGGIPQPD
jgi:cobalamin-dependent methionine synthase I